MKFQIYVYILKFYKYDVNKSVMCYIFIGNQIRMRCAEVSGWVCVCVKERSSIGMLNDGVVALKWSEIDSKVSSVVVIGKEIG